MKAAHLLVTTLLSLAMAGCGSADGGVPDGPFPPGGGAQVTDSDANKVLQFHRGDTFEVILHQQPGWGPWQNLVATNPTVLLPQVDTKAAAVRGVTIARFRANAPGTSDVTASATPDCSPGIACPALARVWKVTIQVG